MVVSQGDVFWAVLPEPFGGQSKPRPVVVVQSDMYNRAGINSVVVCHFTTTPGREFSPGNVVVGKGEANLPSRSIVNVTQVATVTRAQLVEKIGTLSSGRLAEVLAGVCLVLGVEGSSK